MEMPAQQAYRERLQRVEDAIQLKVPDRVPFFPLDHFLAARYAGITSEEAFYDFDKWFAASRRMIEYLEPDIYFPPVAAYPGKSLDALDCRQLKWPGRGIPPHSTFQYVEGEYMKADEYDAFLDDPSDYLIRVYLGRVFGRLEPLQTLPPLRTLFLYGYKGAFTSAVFATPEIVGAFSALYEAGVEARKYAIASAAFDREMASLGFPAAVGGGSVYVPFDIFSDVFRGMKGIMLDMYRQPDKLLDAMDRILPILIQGAVAAVRRAGNTRVFIPLHRGSDGFMSLKQFETFYWPGFKKLVLALMDEGLTPCLFFEGNYNSRLEYLTEFPKGKILGLFDSTDIFLAKKVVGGTMCLAGDMPLSLLQSGTPDKVKEYTKKLIDIVGKDGGFVMSSRTVLDDADPELVKVWADFTREYGVYH